jgi:hypothetical protein
VVSRVRIPLSLLFTKDKSINLDKGFVGFFSFLNKSI